ncbi:MAG: phage tail tube protein [Catonella sp.]
MEKNITMKASDAISAKMAKVFVTINGSRYNLMNAINLEAKLDKTKTEVPILGQMGAGNKATGWKGTGSATFHYNTSIFREIAEKFKDTGEDTYFEIQITNEDPTSKAGRQTVVLIGCNIDSCILAKFDADGENLDEDMDFTFEDYKMPEKFNLLPGMV